MTTPGRGAAPGPFSSAPPFRRPGRGGAGGRVLLGVCAGLARRWELRPRTARLALAITLLPLGAGLLVYAALALVMPADGATDADAGWRSELGRSIAQALVVLAAVFAVALIGSAAGALALFGLGPVALLLATAALTAVIVLDHPRTWLLGLATLALAAPAAAVELTDTSIARQAGSMRVAPAGPGDIPASGYRAGLGSLLVDLRDFDAEDVTTTTIRARADLRNLVVALPVDRCFNVEVEYGLDRSWATRLAGAAGGPTNYVPSAPGYPGAVERSLQPQPVPWVQPTTLVAYGRAYPGDAGRYRRPAPDPSAPTLRLELQSGRSQIHVRDYPVSVDPLRSLTWPDITGPSLVQIDDELRNAARRAARDGRTKPSVKVQRQGGTAFVSVSKDRATRTMMRALEEWLEYPAVQSRQLAGGCAARSQVRALRRRLAATQEAEARSLALRRPSNPVTALLTARPELTAILASQRELSRVRAAADRGERPRPSGVESDAPGPGPAAPVVTP